MRRSDSEEARETAAVPKGSTWDGGGAAVTPILLWVALVAPLVATFAFGMSSSNLSAPRQEDAQAKKIEELIHDLGADDVAVREKAADELQKIGKPALGALAKAAESKDIEVRARATRLIEKIKTLRVDDQGRVLVERDDKGWNVEYTRDEFGNVVKKSWVNPENRSDQAVRLFTFDVVRRRLVEERDPAGRAKRLSYGNDGTVKVELEDSFIEESDQVKAMAPPRNSPYKYEYDGRDRVNRRPIEEKK